MERERSFFLRLAENAELFGEPVPGQSIVEIGGDNRVLIENHMGVRGYSRENILVKVKYGSVCVSGCGLEIRKMTREQLVICGKIRSVTLQGR